MTDTAAGLPDAYQHWLAELIGADPPREQRISCDRCVMADPTQVIGVAFSSSAKCCTYLPDLPNFLVGRVLRDGSVGAQAGRASIRKRIEQKSGVSPLGLLRTFADEGRYRQAGDYMGRREDLRCPHYVDDTGACSIWEHRHAVCATWFCRHERGAVGHAFWTAVKEWLQAVESELAMELAEQLGVSAEAIRRAMGNPGERRSGIPDGADAMMPLWSGLPSPEEFYVCCAEKADALTWHDIQTRMGPEVRLRGALVRARHDALGYPIPDRLTVGNHQVIAVSGEGHWASTYSPYDPVGVPAVLHTVLHCFDGRSVAEVRAALHEERGIAIQDELLRQLVDWGVLVDANREGTSTGA